MYSYIYLSLFQTSIRSDYEHRNYTSHVSHLKAINTLSIGFTLVFQNWAKGIFLLGASDYSFRLVFVAFSAFVHSLSVSRFASGFYRAMSMSMAIVVFAVLITNAKLYHRSCQQCITAAAAIQWYNFSYIQSTTKTRQMDVCIYSRCDLYERLTCDLTCLPFKPLCTLDKFKSLAWPK